MRPRALALLALVAGTAGAGFAVVPGAVAEPSASQTLFRQRLLDDERTSAAVKRLLRTNAGIVDRRSGFVDVTGDGRQDALVLVSTNGAAGTVALYVFSTHGRDAEDDSALRPLLRLQALHRATLRIAGTTVSVVEPRWKRGEDLCCPAQLRSRDYGFDPAGIAFVRTDDRIGDAPKPGG